MDIKSELSDIKDLIVSAHTVEIVKKEVKTALAGKRAIVFGSNFIKSLAKTKDYDLIIKHSSGINASELISRRILSKIPNAVVDKISSSITEDVLGFKNKN